MHNAMYNLQRMYTMITKDSVEHLDVASSETHFSVSLTVPLHKIIHLNSHLDF